MSYEDRGINSTLKDPRSWLNRATIAVRSDRDRGVLPRVAYAVGLESDASKYLHEQERIALHRGRQMEIAQSPCVYAVLPNREIGKECDRPMKIDTSR